MNANDAKAKLEKEKQKLDSILAKNKPILVNEAINTVVKNRISNHKNYFMIADIMLALEVMDDEMGYLLVRNDHDLRLYIIHALKVLGYETSDDTVFHF